MSGLVVLHIDGLAADTLQAALDRGQMPHVRRLIESEGYQVHRYRCGIPSTTPFSQAGILYGDNSEIPSFRWWDRERRLVVQFGAESTFKNVADRYFKGCHPLTEGGAAIAACYPAGAADDFGIAYHDRSYSSREGSTSAAAVVLPYLANPANLRDLVLHSGLAIGRIAAAVGRDWAQGRLPARPYVLDDALEEMFVHHLTRYAVTRAMERGFSPIYAGLYAFDEAGHAFGPQDPYAVSMLPHVDNSIDMIAKARKGDYELVVLSDHGQNVTTRFNQQDGTHLGQVVAKMLPGFRVEEIKGKEFGPAAEDAAGIVKLSFSGGLGHLYFADSDRRLSYSEVKAAHPNLATWLARLDRIALVMARDGDRDVFLTRDGELQPDQVLAVLQEYDDPRILLGQLSRLNSFRASGDLVFFGAFKDGVQINFENQGGGHGSIGGEQCHPFVLAKSAWGIDTSEVVGAHQLHPILSRLRDDLRGS